MPEPLDFGAVAWNTARCPFTVTATVKNRVIATGSATAKAAGTVSVKLKLNAAGRKARKRLKGAKATLRITQGTRSVTKTVTLR